MAKISIGELVYASDGSNDGYAYKATVVSVFKSGKIKVKFEDDTERLVDPSAEEIFYGEEAKRMLKEEESEEEIEEEAEEEVEEDSVEEIEDSDEEISKNLDDDIDVDLDAELEDIENSSKINDELTSLNRAELKELKKENNLNFRILKNDTDEEIRAKIRETEWWENKVSDEVSENEEVEDTDEVEVDLDSMSAEEIIEFIKSENLPIKFSKKATAKELKKLVENYVNSNNEESAEEKEEENTKEETDYVRAKLESKIKSVEDSLAELKRYLINK